MKEKQIEDYIHLYLGCKALHVSTGIEIIVCGININSRYIQNIVNEDTLRFSDIKLLLRPLSSMTEEEKLELFEIQYGEDKYQALSLQFAIATDSLSAEALHYLLSKGFDVFKLIPAKLALDKTLVKN